ncbi:hypothetical protein I6U48_21540 [Clostridium sp. PL3]|uniref:CobQ/CobB/MinD/ParA nucleotide binding domain-containing protein n=1 Tax=Clostridium thailandense TaxID=2794346 RepID=A0A949TN71_9CLOT|nr:hypothetical protein [Clostridium thailandense]MBV7275490.1 hypothetical protein [Clostridium thailandense]
MDDMFKDLLKTKKNFVFIGEAGSGKSEIAINFAVKISKLSDKQVHFFDMDQTKAIFRARDVRENIESENVVFHHEEQYFDAPTLAGGVREQLSNNNTCVVMDVGGNHTGARMIGGFAPLINDKNTIVFFVINPYRLWSKDTLSVDATLSSILRVSHIKKVNIINNPNLGYTTTSIEVIEGNEKIKAIIGNYIQSDFLCVREELYEDMVNKVDIPLIPIKLYIPYPWIE